MSGKVFEDENNKIIITPLLMNKLDILTSEYDKEIGGYITGEVKDGIIYLDDILIPPQVVSAASVEITSSDQIMLLKKYGSKKCQKICGHMHSHAKMGVFWSNRDLITMKDIMTYKDKYIFIVGSNKKYLIKICTKIPFRAEFDNYDLYVKSTRLDGVRKWVDDIMGNHNYEEPDIRDVEVSNICENCNKNDKAESSDLCEEYIGESLFKKSNALYHNSSLISSTVPSPFNFEFAFIIISTS